MWRIENGQMVVQPAAHICNPVVGGFAAIYKVREQA